MKRSSTLRKAHTPCFVLCGVIGRLFLSKMETNIFKRIEARDYKCIAGYLQNDVDWLEIKENKRQEIALEFAKGLIYANPEYIHGNRPIPVPEEVVRLSFEYADAFLNAL